MNDADPTPMVPAMVHPFERAGLGKAPFRFVGAESFGAGGGGPEGMRKIGEVDGISTFTKAGTCCDYCMTYIIDAFWIRSADGRRFKVGSDCLEKTADAKLVRAADGAARKLARTKRHAREATRVDLARTLLAREDVRAKLAVEPHPNAYQASKGATRLDWADWIMANAGQAGRLRLGKALAALA